MHKFIMTVVLVLLTSACNKGSHSNKTVAASNVQQSPGYQAAQVICSQCHALPSPDQFHPAAWPSVIARMEGHMRANNKMLPSDQQRLDILDYFQNSASWKK